MHDTNMALQALPIKYEEQRKNLKVKLKEAHVLRDLKEADEALKKYSHICKKCKIMQFIYDKNEFTKFYYIYY